MTDAPNDTAETPAAPAPAAEAPQAAGGQSKPDIGKRAVAAIIDAVIAFVVGLVPFIGGIAATAYWLVRDGLELDFMDHRSIGKKVMKLRPVALDGQPVDIMTSVKRNWMFALVGIGQFLIFTLVGIVLAIPLFLIAAVIGIIEVVLVFTDPEGRRIGDKIAGTRVIETDS
jgi:uncharacterized RDD family membrane protein YckC